MNLLSIIILGVAIIVFIFLFILYKKQMEQHMKSTFLKLSQEALKSSNEQFLLLAKQALEAEQKQAKADLEMNKQAIESSVGGLKGELEKYEKLMREFERDRERKYGNLEAELKKTSQETNKLQDTTTRLNNILGNVRQRGQWGQRMAEDIIKGCGLIEDINYIQQTKQDSAGTIPDYTFLLPNKHKVNMDVKFPLDNYLQMVNTQDSIQRESYKKEFLNNVKGRIKEIQSREYINPADNTLDFVLLFIPNEQVYGFIQENSPGLIDEAMRQKVILCSPFTLYAMLSVIRQAFENFHYEKATKEIIRMIDLFNKTYEFFKKRFEEMGKSIEKIGDQYDEISEKSFKNLDANIKRIHDYKKGHIPTLENGSNNITEIPNEEFEE